MSWQMRHGRNVAVGRLTLVVIALIYLAECLWVLRSPVPKAAEVDVWVIVISEAWFLFLLGGIWVGGEWARYTLIGLSVLTAVGGAIACFELQYYKDPVPTFLYAHIGIHLVVMLVLALFPPIQKLMRLQ